MPMSEEEFLIVRIVAFVEKNVIARDYSFDHLFQTIRDWRGLGYRFELEQHEYVPGVIAEKFNGGVDEMWFFGTAPCTEPSETVYLSPEDSAVVQSLIDDGVGVFATGDHDCVGSGLCEPLPQRVANMRKWSGSGSPSQTRPSSFESSAGNPDCDDVTSAAGAKDCDKNADYDGFPKPVWVFHRGAEIPHELMQLPGHYGPKRPIRFLPDHMHEGKLFDYVRGPCDGELAALASAYAPGPVPYIVARSVRSVFDNDSNPVDCASYPVVAAYEPSMMHRAWGNIVVDSTFHHWVDKEILTMGGRPARRHVEQFAINLANWLLGSRGRRKVRGHVHQFIAKIFPKAGNIITGAHGNLDKKEIKDLVDEVGALLTQHRFPADMLVPIVDERVDSSDPAKVKALVDTKFPELKGLDVYQLQSEGVLQNLVLGLQFKQLREALSAK